jgi:glycogen operon protein
VKTLVGQRLMLGKELGIEGVSLNELLRQAEIHAHGVRLNEPDLSPDSHSLAFTVRNKGRAVMFHVMFNAYWEPLTFELPNPGPAVGTCWRRWIDTYRDSPDDVCDTPPASPVESASYTVQARSLVVLFALGRDETLGAARTVESRRVGGSP